MIEEKRFVDSLSILISELEDLEVRINRIKDEILDWIKEYPRGSSLDKRFVLSHAVASLLEAMRAINWEKHYIQLELNRRRNKLEKGD
jgi:hypothetical protein